MTEPIDWNYAIGELLDKQGVDLRKEMEVRLLEMEEQFRREKEQSDRLFQEQRRVSGRKFPLDFLCWRVCTRQEQPSIA